jgi:DNA-binding MarR family transcriptional regulator
MAGDDERGVEAVERAMVAIRRRQSRRALARLAGPQQGAARAGAGTVPAGGSAFDVLDAIEAAEAAGGPVGVSGIAAALDVDQPRASKLVAAAVAAGLVGRVADREDGRRALLVRTESGRALTDEVHRFRRGVFSAAMAGWSDAERAELGRLLTRFVEGLGRLEGEGGAYSGRARSASSGRPPASASSKARSAS